MPLAPKYTWTQDENTCTISVTLSSAAGVTRNTRVECTDAMVKVTCPPYFLQLDLFGDVHEKSSRATIQPGVVHVKCTKQQAGAWPQLLAKGPTEEIKERRAAALERKKKRDQEAMEDAKEKKRQDDDYVFHKQWDLEKDEKRTIERLAAIHKKEAEEDVFAWADKAEGRVEQKGDAEGLETYFDKQLVEGEKDADVRDGVVPLPGTYHKKTARTAAMERSWMAEPAKDFDIRKGKKEDGQDKDEKEEDAKIQREEEKRREEEEFREQRANEKEAAAEAEAERVRAEKQREEEEQDKLERERIREAQQQRVQEAAEKERLKNAQATAEEEAKAEQEDRGVSDGEEMEEKGSEEQEETAQKEEQKAEKKEGEEKLLGRRSGASINRWESEKIAERQRVIADAYFKAGMLEDARRHEQLAREAAPWVEDVRNFESEEEAAARKREEEEEASKRQGARSSVPPPREPAKVELNFTKGRRSLPARERIETDEEVKEREAEDLRNRKRDNPDAHGPNEEQAVWLKQRGDHFYRTRDWQAAKNAYSAALELHPRNALALSNRALCALRLHHFADVIRDCTAAFDLLKRVKLEGKDPEEKEKEVLKKVRCLLRRGIAHARLGMMDQALKDLDAASTLAPEREAIKDDLAGLRELINSHPYTEHKAAGDRAFKGGDLEGAVAAFSEAIAADGGCFQALSNRGACWLAMEEYGKCVEDCSVALRALDPTGALETKLALRLLVRRGTALCWQGEFERGRVDFKRALLLDSNNKSLRDDVEMLVTTTGAAASLSEFMGTKLPDSRDAALAALDAAGVPRPEGM